MVVKVIYIICVLACGAFFAIECPAQEVSSIKVITRAHPDSIVLRWAPTSASAWKLLNEYGYKIERYTIARDGQILDPKPVVTIVNSIKPAEQVRWQAVINRDDFVAIAAQAIFGEEFEIDTRQSTVMEIYNKTRELDSRYSFALFAADLSPQAADLSGLKWIDNNVNAKEMYLYRVHSLVPVNLKTIEFGFAYTGPSEFRPLPIPRAPEVENKTETSVLIRWETSSLRDIYIGYYLERSVDKGKIYTKVNELPMSVLSSTTVSEGITYSSKSDTVVIGQNVLYRIRGVNSFGEVGPPSEVLQFNGKFDFGYTPAIDKATVIDNRFVKLSWNKNAEDIPDLSGYDIERSEKIDGTYKKVNDKLIVKATTEFTDKAPLSTNYYRVVAVSGEGQRNNSFSYMVQLEDSIPPLPPTGLKVVIDSTGMVSMKWNKNTEPDLLGYRVFRSRFKNSEFNQVTVSPLEKESFTDTINIKSLSNRMYYKLVAVDNRFNSSRFSEIFELELPDVIPPVPPVITRVRSLEEGVRISWIKSSSSDVKEHRIYRSLHNATNWELIKTFNAIDTTLNYRDRPTEVNKPYKYVVVAVDRSGLQSPMTKTVTGKVLLNTKRKGVEGLKASADRTQKLIELSWKKKEGAVEKYLVYRSKDDEPLTLYEAVSGDADKFIDKGLSMGAAYSYRIKTVFKDGIESLYSDAVKINY